MKVVKFLAVFFALTGPVLNLKTHAQILGYEEFLRTDYGNPLQTGFYQVSGVIPGDIPDQTSGWKHLIVSRHSELSNNYQVQMAASFTVNDRFFFRKLAGQGITNSTWVELGRNSRPKEKDGLYTSHDGE